MKLLEILKPFNSAATSTVLLPPAMEIGDLLPEHLAGPDEIILVGEKGETPLGQIGREVLAYVAAKYEVARMALVLDHLEEGVIAMDSDSRIFYANQTYTQLLGIPLGKIIGKKMRDIEAKAAMNEVLETRRPVISEKIYIETIDRYVSVRIFPIFIRGEFEGVASIFKDVTEVNTLNREISRITQVANEFQSQIRARENLAELDIIGNDPRFATVIEQAMLVAKTDATVLLRGENGTGKEILARLVRDHSQRRDKPFITVNCAAVPENLIESELFGYGEGAFTGAKKGGRAGKLQLAESGTLFLDEVGDMPYTMQGKLLRFLQEGEIERLGDERAPFLDVRVIAATNQHLEEMINEKSFRRDLYFRLNVFSITIPPLRERGHDLLLLTQHFLAKFNQQYGGTLELTREVYRRMTEYNWPGNVRELRNYVERSVILSSWADASPATLPGIQKQSSPELADQASQVPELPLQEALRIYERDLLSTALEKAGNNKSEAMKVLRVSRRTFYRKLNEHGIK